MASDQSPPSDPEHRVLRFRRGGAASPPPATPPISAPVEDLSKYQRSESPDDYRHRMTVNALGFLFVIVLIGAGLWLADTMARMRKNEDCMLSGRRSCAPVEYLPGDGRR